jgi:hypothetical protein
MGIISLVAILFAATIGDELRPDADLLRVTAGIGASLFLAYVIEITWMASQVLPPGAGEDFLGGLTGFGLSGFLGVIALLILSEQGPGEFTMLAEYFLWWSLLALVFLGLMVAMQPYMVHQWRTMIELADLEDELAAGEAVPDDLNRV